MPFAAALASLRSLVNQAIAAAQQAMASAVSARIIIQTASGQASGVATPLPPATPVTIATAAGLVVPAGGFLVVTAFVNLSGGVAAGSAEVLIDAGGGHSVTTLEDVAINANKTVPVSGRLGPLTAGTYAVALKVNTTTAMTVNTSVGQNGGNVVAEVAIG
jgi:hypothetical protein